MKLRKEEKHHNKLDMNVLKKVFRPFRKIRDLYRLYLKNISDGFNEYTDIISIFGSNKKLKLLYTGTGDAYIAASYYKNYIAFLNEENQALLVVGSNSVKRIFSLYGIEDAQVVEPKSIFKLIKLYVFLGREDLFEILHPHIFFRHTGFMAYMEGIHSGMNFAYMMKNIVFESVLQDAPAIPRFNKDQEYIEFLEKQKGMERNNSVILVPGSTTIKALSIDFWVKLAQRLKEKGLRVFVNSDDSNVFQKLEVDNLVLPYKNIVPVLDSFNCFVVGMRCGLFDVISSSICLKILLYNDNEKRGCAQTADLLSSFSLPEMYGNCNAKEYMVSGNNQDEVLECIIKDVSQERLIGKEKAYERA